MACPDSQLLPLGDFKPSDEWQTHVNGIFYGIKGPEIHHHFQTYVSRDYRLAHALADEFLKEVQEHGPGEGPITVQEWGVGNGNLAARFLSRLQSADTDQTVYPRIHYTLCDYSEEILKGVRANPNLQEHEGRYFLKPMNAETQDDFEPHTVHKIISNEIWDDLATSVLLKNEGMLYEEYLQPLLPRNIPNVPMETFVEQFAGKNLDALKSHPPFLEAIIWERSFQRTDISDWPFGEVILKHLDRLEDEIPIPINTGAFQTLERAKQHLAENNLGYSSFDYGMLSDHELNLRGRPYYKLYGGQYTSMVNFPLIAEVAQLVGFADVQLEHQHDFVGRNLSEKVLSALELVQVHPKISRMEPWDADLLMLQTLQALNASYRSPYKGKMDYPPMPGTPKKQRKQIAEMAKNLSATGVPDTVAYITASEVTDASGRLKKLGYGERDLIAAFDRSSQPIAFGHMTLR
jgi:SAM-dependent MidA family methyltransferase